MRTGSRDCFLQKGKTMENNRPRARRKTVSSGGSGVFKQEGGQSVGPVGSSGGPGGSGGGYQNGGGGPKRSGGGGLLKLVAVVLALLIGGGGGAASGLFGNLGGGSAGTIPSVQQQTHTNTVVSNGWYDNDSNNGKLNRQVSPDARAKFTTIKGNGKDTYTILVYMCGTDLESNSGMATNDLQEMLKANVSDNINLVIFTGGCKSWRNDVMSSKYNQVYQIRGGKLARLVDNAGTSSMTDPKTLQAFVEWGFEQFPANRRALIFWDHGSGSISGYGYDQKYPNSGAMSLAKINQALSATKQTFDFIGFDTCLLGTTEIALMLSDKADYMIASEEAEPGVGWYYTYWLNELSADPSMSTLDIGKNIVDGFTEYCAKTCRGQETTLSVVDLSELGQTVPDKLAAFATEASKMIESGDYKQVATARSGSREFAASNRLDQVDLVHFAKRLNTASSRELATALLSAIKYNRTSSRSLNAYGLSIYFPYKKVSKVDSITDTYQAIDMPSEYTSCIHKFAQLNVGGQSVSQGSYSPFSSLFGGSYSPYGQSSGGYGGQMSSDAMQELLQALLGGRFHDFSDIGLDELDDTNTRFLTQDTVDVNTVYDTVTKDRITEEDLVWQKDNSQNSCIKLTEKQWELIDRVDKAMYYQDEEGGYIELGLDNLYSFNEAGDLLPDLDRDWISINGQPVAYYHINTIEPSEDQYTITGYVPIKLNKQRALMFLVFDQDNENGYIAGISYDYAADVTETLGKTLTGLESGDKVTFLCDYYMEDGTYKDSYKLGDTWKVENPDDYTITNTNVGEGKVKILYRLTDIYGRDYWMPEIG